MKELVIKKGGIVEYTRWDADQKPPRYVTKDVTDKANRFLFRQAYLEEDVTLRDIFLILQRHLDFYDELLGNWCKDIVAEAFSKDQEEIDKDSDIEYLELYWLLTEDKENVSLEGYQLPSFHGHGTEGSYGVSLTPAYQLLDCPLKLRQEIYVYNDICSVAEPPRSYQNATYTLGDILYVIIWELSFFGSPSMRDKKAEVLLGAATKICEADKPKSSN